MADHIVATDLLLRYDTYGHWMNSDRILRPGEAAVAFFQFAHTFESTDAEPENTPPAVGIKIGDGEHYFYELPWVQAVAADVYSWAKSSTKPTYSANEISGLTEFINQHGGGGGSSGESSTSYRLYYDAEHMTYTLQYYDEDTQSWEDTSSVINLAAIVNRINTIERWANGAKTQLGNIELSLADYIYDEVIRGLGYMDYTDSYEPHQFVSSISQIDGLIEVTHDFLSAEDITSGVLPTTYGGTGLSRVEEDELLVGTQSGAITVRKFVDEFDINHRSYFATIGAIKDYIDEQTEGLTGAMHFIGFSTVPIINDSQTNPQIRGYNFYNVSPGDVIIYNAKEFVWNGDAWQLLGDEGSYAIKGSITNTDLAENANIHQSKILGLEDALNSKVDKEPEKSLISDEDLDKLSHIEEYAQENLIEHIFLNDEEIEPATFQGNPKSVRINALSAEQARLLENKIEIIQLNGTTIPPEDKIVNIELNEFTDSEKEKLSHIEDYAERNAILYVYLDGDLIEPTAQRYINIQPDYVKNIYINNILQTKDNTKSVHLNVVDGAVVPNGNTTESVTVTDNKLELSRIAKTGDIKDLLQTENTYIVLDCGTSQICI